MPFCLVLSERVLIFTIIFFNYIKNSIGYREWNYEPTRSSRKIGAEICAGFMWWWIGWHLITEWRHLVGEKAWPNRCEWTDEELGISQD